MNALTVVLFACVATFASSAPTTLIGASGVVGPHGAVGPAGVVTSYGAVGPDGIANAAGLAHIAAPLGVAGVAAPVGLVGLGALNDGQWHGEGLLASQDLTGQAARALSHSGVVVAPGVHVW